MLHVLAVLLSLCVFPALIAYSAATDLLRMTISNRLCLALVAGFLLLATINGLPLAEIGWHAAAGATVLVVTFAMFAFGWIGGGDAKVAAATALWLGFGPTLDYLVFGALFGGALTLGLLQMRTMPLPAFAARQPWVLRLHDRKTGIPYGIALAAAALTVYPQTVWMAGLAG